jgi:hypothetical protein
VLDGLAVTKRRHDAVRGDVSNHERFVSIENVLRSG